MAANNSLKPLKIEILNEKSLKLLGCVYYGDPFHSEEKWSKDNEIGLLWSRFYNLYEKHRENFEKSAVNEIAYEVHIQPGDYSETGKFYVYVGLEVDRIDEVPLEMFCKILPSTKYAIFTFKGREMFKGGEYIWQEWLPNSEYEETYPYLMLAYHKSRYYGLDSENSEVDYYIPIKPKKTKTIS
jgi:AraC family transcriptional regulator